MVGTFTISLDLEKKWGMLDMDTTNYNDSFKNVDMVITHLLALFSEYNIRASWAFVGALLIGNKKDLMLTLTKYYDIKYENNALNVKNIFEKKNFDFDMLTAKSSIRKIAKTNGQELLSHSFFHSYFNEPGISQSDFENEKLLFDKVFKLELGLTSSGIVFPRNQVPEQNDLKCYEYYRSNLDNIFDRGYSEKELSLFIKILRTLDSYFPLRKSRSSRPKFDLQGKLAIPSTRFLRPVRKFKFLSKLQLIRIKKEMLWAAKNDDFYHLWWHPHNFGLNPDENLELLKSILDYFDYLNKKYGMKSYSMLDIYNNSELRYE